MLRKIQLMYDKILTAVGAVLVAIMFLVITINVILRLIPAVGGFSWYMEFSQYANVWGMLIGAAGCAAMGTNLRVELIDSILEHSSWGHRFTRIVMDIAELAFYCIMTYSGYLLASRAIQRVSTMPAFTMGQVYWMFVFAGIMGIIGSILHILVVIQGTDKNELPAHQQEEGGIK